MKRISWRRVMVVFVLSVWIRGPRGTSRANAQGGGRGDDEPTASRTIPNGNDGADPPEEAPVLSDDRDRRGDEERHAIADDPAPTDDAEYRETAAGAVADDENVHRDGTDDESASRDHQRMWGAAGSTTAAAGSAAAEGAGGSAAASEDAAAPAPTAGGDEHRHPRAFDTAKHHFPPERQEHQHQHTNGDRGNAPKVQQDEGAKHPHTGSGEGIRGAGTAPDGIPANATTAFATTEGARQRPAAAPHDDDGDEAAAAARATGAPPAGTPMAAAKAFVVSPTKKPGSNKSPLREPPEGYVLSARVYIDPNDRLAHFDPAPLRIPYWDCGYAGSTTSPLPLRDAYFRHAITGATSSWTGTDGRHAVLAVALAPLAVDLNSGESREFAAGDVILLEDVLLPGHKIRPLQSNHGVSILFLTLPGQHTHTGKDRIALPPSLLRRRVDPCPNDHPEGEVAPELDDRFRHATIGSEGKINMAPFLGGTKARSVRGSSGTEPTDTAASARSAVDAASFTWTSRRLRRFVFSVVGLSLSSLAADFLGKTAPLWLAVGVGGTCFVVGGTWAVASLGDALWTGIEVFVERRKLKVPMNHETSIVADDEDEDKDKQ